MMRPLHKRAKLNTNNIQSAKDRSLRTDTGIRSLKKNSKHNVPIEVC